MASIHELEWEMAKMFETVKIEDIFRYYPFCEGSEHQKVMSKFEQEELFFWAFRYYFVIIRTLSSKNNILLTNT